MEWKHFARLRLFIAQARFNHARGTSLIGAFLTTYIAAKVALVSGDNELLFVFVAGVFFIILGLLDTKRLHLIWDENNMGFENTPRMVEMSERLVRIEATLASLHTGDISTSYRESCCRSRDNGTLDTQS